MRIGLTQQQADQIGLGASTEQTEIIRACFFLGHSMIFITELLNNPRRKSEAEDIVEMAYDLGMDQCDIVEIYPTNRS